MSEQRYNYFVIAAIVASELNRAMLIAKDMSLTASNAKALTLRAGQDATGFRAITDFINEMASLTINAAKMINEQAVKTSRIATDSFRAEYALQRFDLVYKNAADAEFLSSLDTSYKRTKNHRHTLHTLFDKQVVQLEEQLEELAKELRTATILATMSRVEASQSGSEFEQSLNDIAHNVADAAKKIQQRVIDAQKLIEHMT
jgi:uncharacterized membrane protein YgaE (UPF0421/DUF939 family)